MRRCSRIACPAEAVATLTFDYADAMAVIGPLALAGSALSPRDPQGYDLCARHAERTSAPVGWQVVRHSVR